MTDLEWTEEPPEKEGYYWMQEVYRGEWLSPEIKYVAMSHGRLKTRDTRGYPGVTELDARWAGPIPEPTEPDA